MKLTNIIFLVVILPCIGLTILQAQTVKDIDGNVYHTIKIGNQVWLVENLKTTKYRNGDSIPKIIDNRQWTGLATGAYSDIPGNNLIYGKLYNWYTLIDSRNICPDGWHVPTDAEWENLIDFLGGKEIAGGKLKEKGETHWISNNGATNLSGFTALPGGFRSNSDGSFYIFRERGFYWSISEHGASKAGTIFFYGNKNIVSLVGDYKKAGFSVRCIKNK
jgi:uncharacterized protein (TIGR02145 family)